MVFEVFFVLWEWLFLGRMGKKAISNMNRCCIYRVQNISSDYETLLRKLYYENKKVNPCYDSTANVTRKKISSID